MNKMRVMFICPFKNMLRLYHSSAQYVKIFIPLGGFRNCPAADIIRNMIYRQRRNDLK